MGTSKTTTEKLEKLQTTLHTLNVDLQLANLELGEIIEEMHAAPVQESFLDDKGNVREDLFSEYPLSEDLP